MKQIGENVLFGLGVVLGVLVAIIWFIGFGLLGMTLCQDIYYIVNDVYMYTDEILSLLIIQIGAAITLVISIVFIKKAFSLLD